LVPVRSDQMIKVLLEGRPAVGKTTAARRVAALLGDAGIPVAGFVTDEVRDQGRRVGFAVETLDGERATLAHVRFSGPPRVSRYGVDLGAFERVALPALERRSSGAVVIVDELGKMELFSERFRAAVGELFERDAPVLATVQVGSHPFTDALKRRADAEVVRVTAASATSCPSAWRSA
jgi:nucleoside-triphosphatase